MYFNEKKSNTNIDNEFKSNKKFNFDFSKYKIPIFIGGGILIIVILLIVILSLIRNNNRSYYIELLGNDVITIYVGDTFNEFGYNAYDNSNNNLTNEVIVDNQVDTSMVGEYQITYTLYDTIEIRYVNVINKPVGATSLFLKGDINMYLEIDEEYTEPGYVVIDSIDGSLKDKVKINNNVDTSKAGTYKVIYSVVNSSGVTTSAIRTVIVLGSEISLNLSNESYTNKDIAINIYIADNYFDYLILPNGDKVTKNEYSYKVSENGTYTFTSYNKLGKKKEESIKVNNINKTSPTGSCSGSYKNGSSSVKINATDDIGISKYVVNGVTSTSNSLILSSEVKTANVTIYDKAGNTKTISCNLTNNNSSSSNPSSSGSAGNISSNLDIKDTTDSKKLNTSLKKYLSANGSSVEKLEKYIYDSVSAAGKGTREGVVAAAVSLINYLYDNYKITIPYYWGGAYQHYGINENFGQKAHSCNDAGNCYYYRGFDCSGFVSWAIMNGGFKIDRRTTVRLHSKFSGDSCNIKEKNCVGKPGDLINSRDLHVQLIVAVDEKRGKYIIAESTSNSGYGLIMREWDMHKDHYGYSTRILHLDDFYSKKSNIDSSY